MKPVALITAVLLLVVAVLHLLRLLLKVQVTVAGAVMPLWISGLGCVVTAALAFLLWKESRPR